MIAQGDLLLVPFPFSDQSGRKVRPVVVVSNSKFNDYADDVIVVGITSNLSKSKYTLSLSNNELEEGRLFSLCNIKVENILKLEKSLIIKKIGKLNGKKIEEVKFVLDSILKV